MILRQEPEHPEEYYAVGILKHLELTSMGYPALYMYKGKYYYKKAWELERILEGDEDN